MVITNDHSNSGSPIDVLAHAFALLTDGPGQPSVNGRAIGGGLPRRLVPVSELARLLPILGADVRDAVWRELVLRARSRGSTWVVVAAGLVLPGLRNAAGSLTRGYRSDPADIDTEVIAGFLAALREIDIDEPAIAWRLCKAAYNAGARARYAAGMYAARHVELPEDGGSQMAPRAPWSHPDLVLADAVAKGVLSVETAELIGRTRLEGRTLRAVAEELRVPYATARRHRREGEERLVALIRSGDVRTIMNPIADAIPYSSTEGEHFPAGAGGSAASSTNHPSRRKGDRPSGSGFTETHDATADRTEKAKR